jgi:membrane protein implicated in regulation of membrane protease activity
MPELASILWLESIPFWILLAAGLVLVGIDVYLTNDNHVMWVGFAVIATAIASAAHLPGEYQIIVFAGSLVACMLYVRRLVAKIPRVETQASSVIDLEGAVGTVLNPSSEAAPEARALIRDHGEWRIICEPKDHVLTPGERVRVVGREGLVLVVSPAPRTEPVSGSNA